MLKSFCLVDSDTPTNFLDVPLDNAHLVKLSRNIIFDALEQKVALHVLQPLLLTHSLLLTHQEVQIPNVGAVGEQFMNQNAAEVASSTSDEYILAWKSGW